MKKAPIMQNAMSVIHMLRSADRVSVLPKNLSKPLYLRARLLSVV